MYMSQRWVSVQDRLAIKQLLILDPLNRIRIPAIMGQMIYVGAVGALVAYAGRWVMYGDKVAATASQVYSDLKTVVSGLNNLQFSNAGENTISISLVDANGNPIRTSTFVFTVDNVADPGLYQAQISDVEFARYTQSITEQDADIILTEAAAGYAAWIGQHDFYAALKHQLRLAGVDRAQYVQALQGAVQKWLQNTQAAAGKWAQMANAISAPAIKFAILVTREALSPIA